MTLEDFYSTHHRYVWAAMVELAEDRQPFDPLTVRVTLEQQGRLDEVGVAYLFGLVDGVPHSMNVPAYATRVRELSDRRRLIATARKLETEAFD